MTTDTITLRMTHSQAKVPDNQKPQDEFTSGMLLSENLLKISTLKNLESDLVLELKNQTSIPGKATLEITLRSFKTRPHSQKWRIKVEESDGRAPSTRPPRQRCSSKHSRIILSWHRFLDYNLLNKQGFLDQESKFGFKIKALNCLPRGIENSWSLRTKVRPGTRSLWWSGLGIKATQRPSGARTEGMAVLSVITASLSLISWICHFAAAGVASEDAEPRFHRRPQDQEALPGPTGSGAPGRCKALSRSGNACSATTFSGHLMTRQTHCTKKLHKLLNSSQTDFSDFTTEKPVEASFSKRK